MALKSILSKDKHLLYCSELIQRTNQLPVWKLKASRNKNLLSGTGWGRTLRLLSTKTLYIPTTLYLKLSSPAPSHLYVTMLPEDSPAKHVQQKLSSHIPSFSDIFDEESFYIFFACITVAAIVGAFIASRHITIKDAGHLD